MLTTRGDDDSRAAAMAAGASLYMTKPFVPQALAGAGARAPGRQNGGRATPARRRQAVSDGDDEFIAGFIDDYFAECEEHLTSVRPLLLTLEAAVGGAAADPAILDELFAGFHSLKGISGMVELREAEMLAHDMESYLRALRQREATLSQAGVDALIGGVDVLERAIAARREQPGVAAGRLGHARHRRGRPGGCGRAAGAGAGASGGAGRRAGRPPRGS